MSRPFNERQGVVPRRPRRLEAKARGRSFEGLRALLPDRPSVNITEDHIQSLITARRAREAIFGRQLFSDPAWDLILELFAARLGKRRMSAIELARAIDAPDSVLARWIAVLAKAGVVHSSADGEHNRATVELTEEAAAKIAQLAGQWGAAFVAI